MEAEDKEGDEKAAGGDEKKDEERMEEDQPHSIAEKPEGAPASSGARPDEMQVDSAATSDAVVQKAAKMIPHSRVVRAAELALKSASKAAGALADAEDSQIRSTLASLIKLTLTKLELKTAQFEELEELLEEERKSLESARIALVSERANLRRMLDHVKTELAKHSQIPGPGLAAAVNQAQAALAGSTQGTRLTEVQGGASMEGEMGPVGEGANVAALG